MITTMVMYTTTMASVRISILLLYCRIFCTPKFRRLCWVAAAVTICWWIASVLVDILQCRPINAAWDPKMMFSPQCIDFQKFWYGLSGSSVVMDTIILIMPIYMVWQLKMKKSQKVLLSGIFLVGCL